LENRYDIEFLTKDKDEIKKIHTKIAYSSPQALLDTMWRGERDRLKEKDEKDLVP
jgi:hypothetical protein